MLSERMNRRRPARGEGARTGSSASGAPQEQECQIEKFTVNDAPLNYLALAAARSACQLVTTIIGEASPVSTDTNARKC